MTDEDLQHIVHCEKCDEELIAAFSADHVCDPEKLKRMVVN